jgi:hypothetical protein
MFYFASLTNIGALFNATLHKYLFVTGLVSHDGYRPSKTNVKWIIFITQILWPLAAAVFAWNADLHPLKTVEETKRVSFCDILCLIHRFQLYPDIFAWTVGRPCAWSVSESTDFFKNFIRVDFLGRVL